MLLMNGGNRKRRSSLCKVAFLRSQPERVIFMYAVPYKWLIDVTRLLQQKSGSRSSLTAYTAMLCWCFFNRARARRRPRYRSLNPAGGSRIPAARRNVAGNSSD